MKGSKKVKKPIIKPYLVTAEKTTGDFGRIEERYATEEEARKQADYLHTHPGAMNVELEGPPVTRILTPVSPQDQNLGAWLAAALEDRKVSPTMKFDINAWLDSKDWK